MNAASRVSRTADPHRAAQPPRALKRLALLAVVQLLLLLGLGGCATVTSSRTVMPLNNRDTVELNAAQTAELMSASGFTRREIIANGPDLRNALAVSGAAQIRRGSGVMALFVAEDSRVHVSSRDRGMFVYRLEEGNGASHEVPSSGDR